MLNWGRTHIFKEAGWRFLSPTTGTLASAWYPPSPARAETGVVAEGGVGVAPAPSRPDCRSIASSADGFEAGAAAGLAGSAGLCGGGDRKAAIDADAGGRAAGGGCGV
jgi:hypothetical protein